MPVRARGTITVRVPAYGCVQELLFGAVMLGGPLIAGTYAGDRRAMQADWREHGERLTAAWVHRDRDAMRTRAVDPAVPAEYRLPLGRAGGPGSRPWAWWEFTAPEPRRPGETEAEFLVRHGLLLPGEAVALKGGKP